MSVPSLQTENLDNSGAPPTPHQKSGRRLSKTVMRSDSQDAEGSKGWGMVALNDGSGTERAVRVVQKAEAEDFNMMKVSWVWTEDGQTNQIDLRHGRISGIRKIYVNKELITREGKNLKNLISDSGSTHYFEIGPHSACIDIRPKGKLSGFTYQLMIDENPIEQSLGGPTSDLGRLDIGTRAVQLPKTSDGLGMTLRNNPLGPTGVVVWTVEPGKAAERAGIGVGDVVLSIEDNIVQEIDHLVEYVSHSVGVVNMELAGTAQSRTVVLRKRPNGEDAEKLPIGLGLQTTSCGIGILVTEIDPGSAAWVCKEEGGLRLGDAILSINGTVPSSPKHAVNLIVTGGSHISFQVIDDRDGEPTHIR